MTDFEKHKNTLVAHALLIKKVRPDLSDAVIALKAYQTTSIAIDEVLDGTVSDVTDLMLAFKILINIRD